MTEGSEVDAAVFQQADFCIVGIGASAGGIQALKLFFEQVPVDSGMAYVVILHLMPDRDSKLAEVLSYATTIPVTQVNKKMTVAPNNVYVIPPNQHLVMEDGYINISPNLSLEERRAPVDIFFRTLAKSHGHWAICVILSGTGANGSAGLKRIKEAGGVAFVQNPREAEFNEMPRNAIATDLVDEVLTVAKIPAKIRAYRDALKSLQISVDEDGVEKNQQTVLREIFTHLRLRTGHDFTNYKRPTLLRRIERRIHVRNLPDLPAYASYMRDHQEETTALLKDILISVTSFYRDPRAFEVIENEVLPAILTGKTSQDQIRIWVAGCATGEEAYSLAILCAEKTLGMIDAPKIQIFATDIDDAAIAHAREGMYTINDAAAVSIERLRRFFVKEGDEYRVRREIREMVLFAQHSFIKDPPFSHLDLVTCRNVLIYFNQFAQQRAAETFHFALKPGRFLFLGSSESVEGLGDLYSVSNKECHIFQTRQVASRAYPVPESVPAFHGQPGKLPASSKEIQSRMLERITFGDLHQRMLEQYAPPSLVVNEAYEIVHVSERAGRYLQVGGGEPSQNLLKLIRKELRLDLRAALYQAVQKKSVIEINELQVSLGNNVSETIRIIVKPVFREEEIARGFILVVFEPEGGSELTSISSAANEPVARQLEEELMRVKTQLRSSVDHYEFQKEDLKASNEELQAMNEELRSSAEELETSKEELQSINEELRTVNQELKVKIEETTLSGNNLRNLINSVGIGTIFLDRDFKVMFFTPHARNIFNLIPSDFGRPLSDITGKLIYANLAQDAALVLEKLQTVEKEVHTSEGQVYFMRILPYRTGEDRIGGVVITFVEVTALKAAEEEARKSEVRLKMLNDAIPQLIWTNDAWGNANYFNQRWYEYTGLLKEPLAEKDWLGVVHPDDVVAAREKWLTNLAQGEIFDMEMRLMRADSVYRWHIVRSVPVYDLPGKIAGWFGSATDVDALKNAEKILQQSSERFRTTIENTKDIAIITTDIKGKIENWNKGAIVILGYAPDEVLGKSITLIFSDQDNGNTTAEMQLAMQHGSAESKSWHKRKDGTLVLLNSVIMPVLQGKEVSGFVKIANEITV